MFKQSNEFWERRFGKPSGVKNWFVYSVEYIDDLSFMPLASEVFGKSEYGSELIHAVGERLKIFRWEGDGDMQILWLPSFTGAGPSNNFGCYAFHVKQNSDGISWVASPYALPFHRLFQPDVSEFLPAGNNILENAKWRRGRVTWTMELSDNSDEEIRDENC